MASIKNEEARLQRKLTEVSKQIGNFMDVVRSAGGDGFTTIKDELAKLEKAKVEIESDLSVFRARIEMLEAERLPDGMIVAAYRRLAEVLKRAEPMELQKLLPTIVRKIVWTPAADGTRGGRYKMQLFPTPLIPESLHPGDGGDTAVGSYCRKVWLPR